MEGLSKAERRAMRKQLRKEARVVVERVAVGSREEVEDLTVTVEGDDEVAVADVEVAVAAEIGGGSTAEELTVGEEEDEEIDRMEAVRARVAGKVETVREMLSAAKGLSVEERKSIRKKLKSVVAVVDKWIEKVKEEKIEERRVAAEKADVEEVAEMEVRERERRSGGAN